MKWGFGSKAQAVKINLMGPVTVISYYWQIIITFALLHLLCYIMSSGYKAISYHKTTSPCCKLYVIIKTKSTELAHTLLHRAFTDWSCPAVWLEIDQIYSQCRLQISFRPQRTFRVVLLFFVCCLVRGLHCLLWSLCWVEIRDAPIISVAVKRHCGVRLHWPEAAVIMSD